MGTFADALRSLLDERGVSQRELARRLGISAQAVNSWLNAGITPGIDKVERIEDNLAVDPRGSLLELAGYSLDQPAPVTPESAIRADPNISAEDKRLLLRMLAVVRRASQSD